MYENLFKSPLHRVFVYGTLKRGEPNHGLLKDTANGYAKFLGVGRTTVPYPLVIATRYNIPFLLKRPGTGNGLCPRCWNLVQVLASRNVWPINYCSYSVRTARSLATQFPELELGPSSSIVDTDLKHVLGEIYDVNSDMLRRLDELEEHPKFYERTEENVLLAPEAALKPGKTFEEVGESTKAWIYFLPRYKSSLLHGAMYASYTNNGSHGLKYCENDEDASSVNDVL